MSGTSTIVSAIDPKLLNVCIETMLRSFSEEFAGNDSYISWKSGWAFLWSSFFILIVFLINVNWFATNLQLIIAHNNWLTKNVDYLQNHLETRFSQRSNMTFTYPIDIFIHWPLLYSLTSSFPIDLFTYPINFFIFHKLTSNLWK